MADMRDLPAGRDANGKAGRIGEPVIAGWQRATEHDEADGRRAPDIAALPPGCRAGHGVYLPVSSLWDTAGMPQQCKPNKIRRR